MTRRLISSVTFLGHILKLTYLGHWVPFYLLLPLVTSILIWPKKKFFFTKLVGLSMNNQTRLAVCRYDSWFSRSDEGGGRKALRPILSLSEPARNRVNPYMPITLLHLQVYICVIHEVRLGFSDFLLLISPGSRGQHLYLYLYLYLHLRAIHIQNAWRLLLIH